MPYQDNRSAPQQEASDYRGTLPWSSVIALWCSPVVSESPLGGIVRAVVRLTGHS
ncbi:hypothetical protein [Amycolatopsis sp. WAC 04182]|uniref:hypothetical protein n=1 Tax=Amycolatopsis sp. WAC 04182 TaxID=2203198 RepID=UPI00131516D4|nr:hypothetical protein [Amycolatopsis sp. WAC 04182]